MNLQILMKVLAALAAVTDNNVSGYAMGLQQALKITLMGEPGAEGELNQLIAQSVLTDWSTFNQVASFTASVLTQGQPQNLPQALQTFERIANETLPVASAPAMA